MPPREVLRAAPTAAVAAMAVAVTTVAATALAAAGLRWVVLAALLVGVAVEVSSSGRRPTSAWLGATAPLLVALRVVSVVVLAARTNAPTWLLVSAALIGTAAALAALLALAGDAAVARLRRPALLSRNLPLADVVVPRRPAPRLTSRAPSSGAAESLLALAVAVGAPASSHAGAAIALAVAAAIVAAVPLLLIGQHALRLHRRDLRRRVPAAVSAAVERLSPQVVVYFAGQPEEVYQPDMWLEPVERLPQPALVVVRDHEALARLAPTSLPVVSTPYNGTLADLALADRCVVLFVTHSGNNVSMLRRTGAVSVFVGHGDSDKPDSANPFARVYDEVWVAGPAGRRRYVAAGIGVLDTNIVEVGRPQVLPSPAQPPPVPTVLYAPTWEGWGDDPHHSSLPHVGPALVSALLDRGDVRVLYRPHPLTGRRSPALRAADAAVRRLLDAAGASASGVRSAAAPRRGDLLDAAVATGASPFDRAAARALAAAADAEFWAAAPTAHHILGTTGPALTSCFAQASLLVGDVSSVVTDFLAIDRPYATVDTRGLGATAYVEQFPTAAGGRVLAPDLTGLDALVDAVTAAADPDRDARHELAQAVLGDPLSGQDRFAAAVGAVLAR